MPSSPEPVNIVVSAKRIQGALSFPSYPSFSDYFYELPNRDAEWTYSPYANAVEDYTWQGDPKRNLIDATIYTYLQRYSSLSTFINATADSMQVSIDSGLFISGAELKQKFNSLRTIITSSVYSPGAAGANYGDRFEINYQKLAGYNVFGQEGINYLILHEIAHNTLTGITSRAWLINSYEDEVLAGKMAPNTYFQSNDYYHRQEGYANTIAKAMADSIGISIMPTNGGIDWPPNGYRAF